MVIFSSLRAIAGLAYGRGDAQDTTEETVHTKRCEAYWAPDLQNARQFWIDRFDFHRLLEHLEAYLAALAPQDGKAPLFRSARGRTGELTAERLSRFDAYAMIRRRAVKAGVVEKIGNHSFRGTGITAFLLNDGTLELAQEMANHASPRTTKLYDRRDDKITQDAVERIRIE